MMRKNKSFKETASVLSGSQYQYGRDDNGLKIDFYAKIPDIIELPITVVNNILYAQTSLN